MRGAAAGGVLVGVGAVAIGAVGRGAVVRLAGGAEDAARRR